MEEQQKASSEPQQPIQQPVVMHKSNNIPLVVAIIFLAIVIAAVAIYFAVKQNTDNNTNIQQAEVTSSPSPKGEPQQETAIDESNEDQISSWMTTSVTKMNELSFPAFTIKHPAEWIAEQTEDEVSQTLTLTKGGNEIKIYRAPTGGSQCVFEGEIPEGPAVDYKNLQFVDIAVGSITLRRVAMTGGFTFCSNSVQDKSFFGTTTLFGGISYKITNTDTATLQEMDKIISTITGVN